MLGPRCSRSNSHHATRSPALQHHLPIRSCGTRGVLNLAQSLSGGSSSRGALSTSSQDPMEPTRNLLTNKRKSANEGASSSSSSSSPAPPNKATTSSSSSLSKPAGRSAGQYRKMSVDKQPSIHPADKDVASSSLPASKPTLPPPIPPAAASSPVPHNLNNLSRHRALVLDCAYRPINVTSWPKAVMMDWTNKAEVVEYYPPPALAQSGQGLHPLPAVVRVAAYVDLHEVAGDVSPTRRNLMTRDKFSCQYCGCKGRENELTLDHVTPVSKGGKNTWLNLVTACMPCNQRKGDRLLAHLPGWKLRNAPRKPSPWEIGIVVGLSSGDIERPPVEWQAYLEPYRLKMAELRKRAQEAGVEQEGGDTGSASEAREVGAAAWNTVSAL